MTGSDAATTMANLRVESDMRISLMVRINELEAEVAKLTNLMLAWQEAARAFARGSLMTGDTLMENAIALTEKADMR